MNIISQNGIYQIEIPNNYEYLKKDGTLNIYCNNDVGVISITSYGIPIDYNFIVAQELIDFIQSIDDTPLIDKNSIMCFGSSNCFAELVDKTGQYWKAWVFYKNNCAVFATYNCDKNDKEIEMSEIDTILSSLKLRNPIE